MIQPTLNIESPELNIDSMLAGIEDFIYQRNSSWNVPYTFSGKEKDQETGYSYFGARYYDSDLSVWLSVVPIAIGTMADKYPSMSPYMYCAGNPVMLVDPDGKSPKPPRFSIANLKLKKELEEIYKKSADAQVEYSALITVTPIYTKNIKSGKYEKKSIYRAEEIRTGNIDHVKYADFFATNSLTIGVYHTHLDREMPFSSTDIRYMQNHIDHKGFFQILNADITNFALVIEDCEKAGLFFKNNPDFEYQMEMEYTKQLMLPENENKSYTDVMKTVITKFLKDSGIGFYETSDRQKTKFKKLN